MPVHRFLPHRTQGEGFFLVVLRKNPDSDAKAEFTFPRRRDRVRRQPVPPQASALLSDSSEYSLSFDGETVVARPSAYTDLMDYLSGTLRVVRLGVPVCTVKGKDLIPSHSFVMSSLFCNDCLPQVSVSEETALSYLRRDSIVLPGDTPRGFVVVTFNGRRLGLVKNLGNRCNNLYPQEWRILKRI